MLIAIGLKSRIARLLKDFENMKPVVILLDIKKCFDCLQTLQNGCLPVLKIRIRNFSWNYCSGSGSSKNERADELKYYCKFSDLKILNFTVVL